MIGTQQHSLVGQKLHSIKLTNPQDHTPTFGDLKNYIKPIEEKFIERNKKLNKEKETHLIKSKDLGLEKSGPFGRWFAQVWATMSFKKTRAKNIKSLRNAMNSLEKSEKQLESDRKNFLNSKAKQTEKRLNNEVKKDNYVLDKDKDPSLFRSIQYFMMNKETAKRIAEMQQERAKQRAAHNVSPSKQFTPTKRRIPRRNTGTGRNTRTF